MPQIIVTADRSTDRGEDVVMLRERVSLSDLESDHFARHLLERLGWAVGDAHEAEAEPPDAGDPRTRGEVGQGLAELSGQQPAQELEGAALR